MFVSTRLWRHAPYRLTLAVVVVAIAALALSLQLSARPRNGLRPVIDQRGAEQLADRYRNETVARIAGQPQYAEAVRSPTPCDDRDQSHRFAIASRYDLVFAPGTGDSPADVFAALRQYWLQSRYTVVDDTAGSGPNGHLLVENPVDGFRIGLTQRPGRSLRLTVSSPCIVLAVAPVPPVLASDLVGPRTAYQTYVAAQLTQLAAEVGTLRAAIAADDRDHARSAWLAAQLTWEHVGAAYGSFGDLAAAIDGLPQGLPLGVRDIDFTGLHRIEYELWHAGDRAEMLRVADRLAGDVDALRASLREVTLDPADLPLRAHEILEDALHDHLSGLTDQGSGAGLAETYADTEATETVLDELATLIDERRPDLLPAARAGLAALRRALLAAEHGGVWASPATVAPAVSAQIVSAIGGLLETLAPVPDLLELPTS